MKEIVEYKLLSCSDIQELTQLVNEHIKDGWQLYGNPLGLRRNAWDYVIQAMVKYKK